MSELISVAVGVIENADRRILISKRHAEVHLGGLWEFPGGKVDAGESATQAVARELNEELGIDVHGSEFLFDIHHDYPERSVCLSIFHITQFSGEPMGLEGQPVLWVARDELDQYQFPEANTAIVEWLRA